MTLLALSGASEVLYGTAVGPAALVLVVGGLVLAAVSQVAKARRSVALQRRVEAHLEAGAVEETLTVGERARGALVALRGTTEWLLADSRPLAGVQRLVARAGLRFKAVDFLYAVAVCGLSGAVAVVLVGGSTGVALLALALGVTTPFLVALVLAHRRERAFDEQLPDVLLTLAASLKVGHSFAHGLQAVAEQGRAPAGEEFSRVLAETKLGKPVESALADLAHRVHSDNLTFVLTAVAIQREVGGSLAGLLEVVAEVVRDRQQLARKLRGLTAMGRASAAVLIALPFAAALGLTAINPEYMKPLYTTSTGHVLIGVGLTMMAVGSLLLKRIVSPGR